MNILQKLMNWFKKHEKPAEKPPQPNRQIPTEGKPNTIRTGRRCVWLDYDKPKTPVIDVWEKHEGYRKYLKRVSKINPQSSDNPS